VQRDAERFGSRERGAGAEWVKNFSLTGNQAVPYGPATERLRIPGMDDDAVFRALADASRRQLLDRLHQRNGQTLGELCRGLDMTRQAVAKHLAVLQEANLVSWKRNGREKLHFINPVPINEIAERWINKFERSRLSALSELKKSLEGERDD
jgi:DNA-binding transcriptional ArsR family regulator